jgi:O-antigen ligase
VLGLLSVVFLYLLPGLAFLRAVRKNEAGKPLALAGLVTTLSYSIFSLSQAFLEHNSGVMMYAFTIIILWSGYRQTASNKPARALS